MPILSRKSVKAAVSRLLLVALLAELLLLLVLLPVEAVLLSCPAAYTAVAISPETTSESDLIV